MRYKFFILISFLFSLRLSAQHSFQYTYFDMAPASLNPALAGEIDGAVRFGVMTRLNMDKQFGRYYSPLFYVDASVYRGLRQQDWIGIGLSLQYDIQKLKSYDISFVNRVIIGGISYHLALDKERKNVLAVGLQAGNLSTYFRSTSGYTISSIQDYIKGNYSEEEFPSILSNKDQKGIGNLGLIFGITFTSKVSKKDNLELGLSIANIGRKKDSEINSNNNPLIFMLFSKYRTEFESRFILESRILFQYKKLFKEGSAQLLFGKKLETPTQIIILGGLGYEFNQGDQFLMGFEAKNIKVVFSYNFNLSTKKLIEQMSTFEVGLSYILRHKRIKN